MIPGNLPSNFHGSQVLLQSLCVGFSLCFAQGTEEIILQWNSGEHTSVVSSVTWCALNCKKKLAGEKLLMIWLGLLKWKWWDFQQKLGRRKMLEIMTGNDELAKHFSVETVDLVPRFLVDGEAVAFQSSGQCQRSLVMITQSSIGNGRGNVLSFQQKC